MTSITLTVRTFPDELGSIEALAQKQNISRHKAARVALVAGLQQLATSGEGSDRTTEPKEKSPDLVGS